MGANHQGTRTCDHRSVIFPRTREQILPDIRCLSSVLAEEQNHEHIQWCCKPGAQSYGHIFRTILLPSTIDTVPGSTCLFIIIAGSL